MSDRADVCLLLEGTYPYVRGGVSSWVHQIITKLPELTFSLIFLGGSRSDYEGQRYELPENVVHLETHYMAEALVSSKAARRSGNPEQFARMSQMHEFLRQPESSAGMDSELLAQVFDSVSRADGITREDFLYSDESWRYVREQHYERCPQDSFVDYFWTVRIMHAPLFQLAEIARGVPEASVFHTISTGYAGLIGAFLAATRGLPLILSEHGIYTKERKIDLAQAEWISEAIKGLGGSLRDGLGYIRKLWIRFFEGLGRLTYQVADPIVSLYEGNRQRQLDDGAPADKTIIVPNGVNVQRFGPALDQRSDELPLVVGFIGRLVPIKDVKTFIRAMRVVCTALPRAEGWLIGSSEEEPEYTADCEALVTSLGLDQQVKFLGFQNVAEILPKLGVVVLTSISEALPLVILEGFAAGVPAVSTDLGACRELIEGRLPEDRALGPAGAVVDIADPEASGRAVIDLLGDSERWKQAQTAAVARVNRFYTQPMMMNAYRDIYERTLSTAGAAAAAERVAAGRTDEVFGGGGKES
ncbi:MAG: GT4 family glycosyltransferase PelF [Myxococcota bacterium]